MARKQIIAIKVERMADYDADVSYLEQEGFEDRLRQYRNGQFGFMGIGAKAEIVIDGVCQTITSGGLWGIEDDSDEAYLATIESDEITGLTNQLCSLGFSPKAITKALDERSLTA